VSDFSTKGPTLSVLHLGRIQFVYNINLLCNYIKFMLVSTVCFYVYLVVYILTQANYK